MANKSNEQIFQNDIINQMIANGWQLGSPAGYNRELALYSEDVLGFVKETQDEQWQKYCKLYPQNTDQHFLERVATQLGKVDPNAANRELRTFGTLGVWIISDKTKRKAPVLSGAFVLYQTLLDMFLVAEAGLEPA